MSKLFCRFSSLCATSFLSSNIVCLVSSQFLTSLLDLATKTNHLMVVCLYVVQLVIDLTCLPQLGVDCRDPQSILQGFGVVCVHWSHYTPIVCKDNLNKTLEVLHNSWTQVLSQIICRLQTILIAFTYRYGTNFILKRTPRSHRYTNVNQHVITHFGTFTKYLFIF